MLTPADIAALRKAISKRRRRAYMKHYMRAYRRFARWRRQAAAARAAFEAFHAARRKRKGRPPKPRPYPVSRLAQIIVDDPTPDSAATDTLTGSETVLGSESP